MSAVSGPGAGQSSAVRRKGSKPGWGPEETAPQVGKVGRSGESGCASPYPSGRGGRIQPFLPRSRLSASFPQPSHLSETDNRCSGSESLRVRDWVPASWPARLGSGCVCASGFCVLGHCLTKFKKMVR